MATKASCLQLEINHFNQFRQHIPRIDEMDQFTVDLLLNMGLIQVSTAAEMACANVADLDVVSVNEYDLSDGSDKKLATARYHSNRTIYGAPVTKTKNKTGALRVQVYEPMTKKFYYFFIPRIAHLQISGKSNIEIPFNMDGTPKRNYSPRLLPNWWNYEVKDFIEMCKKTN